MRATLRLRCNHTLTNNATPGLGDVSDQRRARSMLLTALLIALVARVLVKHPKMNGLNSDVNISLAIAVEDGGYVRVPT